MGKRKFKKKVAGVVSSGTKKSVTKTTTENYSIDDLLKKAQDCIDRFEYEVAHRFCQRVLEIEPDNVKGLETTGTLLMELGEMEAAKQCFGRSVEVNPESGHSKYMYLGQLFDGAQAVQCFQKGIELMVKEMAEKGAQEIAAACSPGDGKSISVRDVSKAYCSIAEIYMTDCCFEADAEEKCRTAVEKAISSDEHNPEAFQMMASFLLSKEDKENAKENIKKSVSLWLPEFRSIQRGGNTGEQFDPLQVCPVIFETRLACSKILIEVGEYETGSEILEGLLDECDEETEVWYLLGWLNHLQGADHSGNARCYLNKAKQVYKKMNCKEKPLLKHIEELLIELGPGDPDDDDDDDDDDVENGDAGGGEEMDEGDWETDSETEDGGAGDMDHT